MKVCMEEKVARRSFQCMSLKDKKEKVWGMCINQVFLSHLTLYFYSLFSRMVLFFLRIFVKMYFQYVRTVELLYRCAFKFLLFFHETIFVDEKNLCNMDYASGD